MRQLVLDARRAREAALDAAPLLHGPHEVGLDRARGLVDVVAVEAEARFQAQRVARAQPDGLDRVVTQQQLPEALGLLGCHRDLEAVLAGVARARDVAVEPADGGTRRLHEGQPRCLRAQGAEDARRRGSLQGQQRPLRRRQQDHAGGQARGDVGVVHLLARGVDDQEQPPVVLLGCRARHHQVVDDAAGIVEQLGIALLAGLQVGDIGRHQGLQRRGGGRVAGPDQEGLAHVRDVEQSCRGACVQVFLEDAQRILHGHLVARERHHLGAQRHVLVMERRASQGLVGSRGIAHLIRGPIELASRTGRREFKPPLSRDLRDFGGVCHLTPSVSRRPSRLLSRVPSTCGPFA